MHLYDNSFDVILAVNYQTSQGQKPIQIPSSVGRWKASKFTTKTGVTEELTLGKCPEDTSDDIYSYWFKRNATDEFLREALD